MAMIEATTTTGGGAAVRRPRTSSTRPAESCLLPEHAAAAAPPPPPPDQEEEEEEPACEDDKEWVDHDGHGCESYKNTISKWGRDRVCKQHWGGVGALYCRATCGTCKATDGRRSAACADNTCIGPWLEAYGRCFQCADFAKGCHDDALREVFRAECPLTCGVCDAAVDNSEEEEEEKDTDEARDDCEDEDTDFCDDLGARYCSERAFADRCRKTCDLCPPTGVNASEMACVDRFSSFTCARYESYGWCTRKDTRDAVRLQCPVTCGVCGQSDASGRRGKSRSVPTGQQDGGRRENEAEGKVDEKSGTQSRMCVGSALLPAMMLLLASWCSSVD